MRKLAREAVIFMLLGWILLTAGMMRQRHWIKWEGTRRRIWLCCSCMAE